MEVRPVQKEKAYSPMFFTLLGMVMEVMAQPSKAYSPMLVTLLGIRVLLQPTTNVFVAVSIMALQLLRESYFALSSATLMEVRMLQRSKACSPILDTLLGIETEVRLVHQ